MCLGFPGRIISKYEKDGLIMGVVDYNGAQREVCLSSLYDVDVGSYVIVHAGFAISKLDEKEARETISLLDELQIHEDF